MSELNFTEIVAAAGGKIVENSSLKTEEVPQVTPPVVTEETPPATTQSVTNPDVVPPSTPDIVTETPPVVESNKASKTFKGLDIFDNINNEFKEENGISLIDAQKIVAVDYDAVDERILMRDFLLASEPGITEKEINVRLRKYDLLYKTNEEIDDMIANGSITEDQFDELDAEWEGSLRKGKQYLKGTQDDLKERINKFEVESDDDNDNSDEDTKQLMEISSKFLPTYINETIKILGAEGKEVDTVNFVPDEAGKKLVSEIFSDPSNVYKMWMDNEGNIDVRQMAKDIYNLKNKDKINKAIYDQGVSKGAMNVVKDQNNIDFNPNRSPITANANISESLASIYNKINGG